MKKLVVGFITDEERVLLIQKNRPMWQKGSYNGVGGKVEKNETPIEGMIREAKEETGLHIESWTQINHLEYEEFTLYVYHANIDSSLLDTFKSLTDEEVHIFNKDNLPTNLVEDVKYIMRKIQRNNK